MELRDPLIKCSCSVYNTVDNIFFCQQCRRLKCNDCVSAEPTSFYCPNCLFDVALASLKNDHGKCARNCFQCPVCINPLTVVSHSDTPTTTSTTTQTHVVYYLHCSHCNWDSLNSNLRFDRPTGIARTFSLR